MSSGSAALAINAALKVAFAADATITALIAGRIVDWPGADTAYPCISIGDVIDQPWNASDMRGAISLVTVHTWAKGATSRQVARAIGEAVADLIDMTPTALTVTGHAVVQIERTMGLVDYEGTGQTGATSAIAHGIYRFELRTHRT